MEPLSHHTRETAEPGENNGMKTLIALLTTLFFALAAPPALAQDGEEGAGPAGPVYVDLGEPVMVNVYDQGVLHFISIDVVALVSSAMHETTIQDYMTPIRHDLMMLYSSQDYPTLYQAETKRRLLDETLEVMQKILKEETGEPVVEEIFFNAFVIQ